MSHLVIKDKAGFKLVNRITGRVDPRIFKTKQKAERYASKIPKKPNYKYKYKYVYSD